MWVLGVRWIAHLWTWGNRMVRRGMLVLVVVVVGRRRPGYALDSRSVLLIVSLVFLFSCLVQYVGVLTGGLTDGGNGFEAAGGFG